MNNAAIIGAGLIGRAWANVFARAGWSVRVWDPDAGQRAAAARLIGDSLHELASHGLVDHAPAAAQRIAVMDTLEAAVAAADYLAEIGAGMLGAKRATF